jgi:EpsD family peptidyl-prolyl cis-trans isomerase
MLIKSSSEFLKINKILFTLLSVIFMITLQGCTQVESIKDKQVLAKVNGDEITIHQLEYFLEKLKQPEANDQYRKQVLDKLINRQLLYQQAIDAKLDRRPEIMARIEDAKLEILANAFSEQLGSKIPDATDADSAAFYKEHPYLFSGRRIYRMHEVTVSANKPEENEILNEVQTKTKSDVKVTDITSWLSKQTISFTERIIVRPPEALPLDVAQSLADKKVGQYVTQSEPDRIVIFEIQGVEVAPVNWIAASNAIHIYLKNQKLQELITDELTKLRKKANIPS